MASIEIAVISLPNATDRRTAAAERLNALAWPWRFFNAHTANENSLPYDPEQALLRRGYRLKPAEIGCFSSHFACMKAHSARTEGEYPYLLVLEDDVVLDPAFNLEMIPALMQSLQIEYLRLFSRFMTRVKYLGRVGSDRGLYRFIVPPYGTQAYVVSKLGARRFVESVSRIDRPVDDELDRYWANQLPTYALYPYPVIESSTLTTVAKGFADNATVSRSHRAHAFALLWREKFRRERANLRLAAQDAAVARALRQFKPESKMKAAG